MSCRSTLRLDRARVPASVPAVRTAVAAWARTADLDTAVIDDLLAVVSELAGNAVRHGGGARFGTEVAVVPDGVLVRVTDGGVRAPATPPAPPDGLADHGRGLALVQALSRRFGWRADGTGTQVGAVLPVGARPPVSVDVATLRDVPGP